MKKIITIIAVVILFVGCKEEHHVHEPVIEYMCKDAADDELTDGEIKHWDEMNEDGGYLLVRGAERELDTIVNHMHFIFITEP